MMEVPLSYPSHLYLNRKCVVDAETRCLRREGGSSIATSNIPMIEETLPGSASVSSLTINGSAVLLATCACLDNPGSLCVSLSWAQEASESPTMMELDLCELELGPLVSVHAFADGESWIRLVLVDYESSFAVVTLTDRLMPVDEKPVHLLKTNDYVEDEAVLQKVTRSDLQATMVTFVSSSVVIMALSPFILTIDLDSVTSYVWSETQCLEDMRTRASSLGSLFTKASELLLGRLEQGVMDMPATAALCLTSTASPLLDPTFCFTLHADASIRKWRIDLSASPFPLEVTIVDTATLPLPSTWSDTRNSVSLCARLYERTYALAVNIKTEGITNKENDHSSDCHLWVFHGTQETGAKASTLVLRVPENSASLVGMSFSPTEHRCTLSALFESREEEDRPATILVTYPASIVSIVSSQPIVAKRESVDDVAVRELFRIKSLLFGPEVLCESEKSSLEEVLHKVDSLYMRYIFRPMFARGTGTVLPPSELYIRRALAKLVHGVRKEQGISIELETVKTMYEWRQREHRKLLPATQTRKQKVASGVTEVLVPTSPYSVYDTFVHDDDEDDDEMEVDGMDSANLEKQEQVRSAEIQAHENRWRRLLIQIWEEEQVIRLPLCVAWLEDFPILVTVRGGITTASQQSTHTSVKHHGPWATLDNAAMHLLFKIEEDKDKSTRLYAVEHQVAAVVSDARLAVAPQNESKAIIHELTALGRWARSDDDVNDGEYERLEECVSSLPVAQLVTWIQETPHDFSGSLPCFALIDSNEKRTASGRITWSPQHLANPQLRHAACSLSIRCVDSVRRLQLGRTLLLLDLLENSHAREAATRAYLHSVAVMWAAAQRLPMPSTAFRAQKREPVRLRGSPCSSSPPKKRLSFGDDASSIFGRLSPKVTTALDVSLIEISQTLDESSSLDFFSPTAPAIHLTGLFFRMAFSSRGSIPIGQPSLLPELGALPPSRDATVATDYPRLGLRLLAPYVACPLPEDSADVLLARKESLAEFLLIESHSESLDSSSRSQMRQMACELLVPKDKEDENAVDQGVVRNAFHALDTFRGSAPEGTNVTQTRLAASLKTMLQTGTDIEIERLCKLETVKILFSSVAGGAASEMDGAISTSIKLVASIMLHLSRVLYRLTILERHVRVGNINGDREDPNILLDFFSGAISDMSKTFPDEVCQMMPEYLHLWTRLFHHAVLAGRWRLAYKACVKNPKRELQESNFRRLVRSMVDVGSLSDLLEMCTELRIRVLNSSSLSPAESSECVDLYELASEMLSEAVSRDAYTVRAAAAEATSLSDFQGALYSLHASQKQWRRAAQSMDLRYLNAKRALSSGSGDLGMSLQASELRDGLIVEDLVLSAVGAVNALELVKDSAHRFLVSGEYGPYNMIPIEGLENTSNQTLRVKRSRFSSFRTPGNVVGESEDRLSNFMTVCALEGRAIRSISLRTLFFDRSSDPSLAKSSFLRDLDSARADIDELFMHGYYSFGLLLARAWSKNREVLTGSSRPGGQDLFYNSLSHMLQTYLIPLLSSMLLKSSQSYRPTMYQVNVALDDVGSDRATASFIASDRSFTIEGVQTVAIRTAVMALIRKLTLAYSTSESSLAGDVASCFLETGTLSKVPEWLERLLMGLDTFSSSQPNGFFARRPKPGSLAYLGNPSALVSLYTKRGMLAEACDIVTATLSGAHDNDGQRENRAASRLPENGDIDFVPYGTIDVLWNLIEIVLNQKRVQQSEATRMRAAREKMEVALGRHYDLMKISESGMRSARALHH